MPRSNSHLGDRAFAVTLTAFGGVVFVVIGVITLVCARLSVPAFRKLGFLPFLLGRDWDPVQDLYGALPFVYGTVVCSLLAVVLAAPVAVGLALFLTEMAPDWLRRWVTFLVELLAGIPSVVYGLWGIIVLVPLLRSTVQPALASGFGWLPIFSGPPLGFGYLAAGVLLAIMILPTIASVTVEVLRTTPGSLREGALALGATRWEAIRMAVLPYATRGIMGAVILGLARALGETMAVTMVIGNSPQITYSLFAAGDTLPSVLANQFAEANGDIHVGALAALALVLFGTNLLVSASARVLVRLSGRSVRA